LIHYKEFNSYLILSVEAFILYRWGIGVYSPPLKNAMGHLPPHEINFTRVGDNCPFCFSKFLSKLPPLPKGQFIKQGDKS
jgi:hypothetical protein